MTLVIGGAAAVGYLAATGLVGKIMAGRLLLIVLLVSLLATLYQMLFVKEVLRPLLRHLGSRHALPLAEVRAPLGLRAKLGGALVAVLVAGCAFVWLFVHAHSPWGRLSLAAAMAAIFGVIALLVRDVVSPLRALEERSREMAKGQLARPVPPWGEADEIGRLAVMFEEMRRSLRDRLRSTESINVDLEREVRRRTEALEQRNAELHEALEKLRRAQDNLVRSEKLASMGRLVAGIAHEINNPVNAVINSLGPLDEIVKKIAAGEGEAPSTMAKEAEEILAVVQRGASRTKAIVQALHGYARGDDSVQREVHLARSVDDTLGLLQHRLRHVKVAKEIEPGVRIMGFPGQIDQVLMNLLDQCRAGHRRAGRDHSHRRRATSTTASRWSSPTTGPASRPTSCRASSIHSSPPRTWARARASAFPSSTASSSGTAGTSRSTASRGRGRGSRSRSRCPPPAPSTRIHGRLDHSILSSTASGWFARSRSARMTPVVRNLV